LSLFAGIERERINFRLSAFHQSANS